MATREIITVAPAPNSIEVFCSYSHRDVALRQELEVHLKPLQAQGLINYWHDHAIPAGDDWESEIDERLNAAQIILLLVSSDFMASKHCQIEMQKALERRKVGKARVIPILLRHVDWHGSPLGKIQALPKDGRPVTNWPDRDQAFKDVTIGIRRVAEKLIRAQTHGAASLSDSSLEIRKYPEDKNGELKKYAPLAVAAVVVLMALLYFGKQGLERWQAGSKNAHARTAAARGRVDAGRAAGPRPPFYGAIDLGSKGVKSFLFSKHQDLCPVESAGGLCQVYSKTINTKLVSSMKDGEFADAGIEEATDAVKQEIDGMQAAANKFVLGAGYYIVASSGVAKAKNKEALAAAVKTATGVEMDFIDARSEGYFGLRSAVPQDQLDSSLYVDVGSGNTKLGCLVGGDDIGSFHGAEIGYGSVSGRNKERNSIRAIFRPASRSLLTGGPPGLRTGEHGRALPAEPRGGFLDGRSVMGHRDVHASRAGAAGHGENHPARSGYVPGQTAGRQLESEAFRICVCRRTDAKAQDDIRQAAEKDRGKVMGTFAREDLLAGVSIMKAVLDASNGSAVITFVAQWRELSFWICDREVPGRFRGQDKVI